MVSDTGLGEVPSSSLEHGDLSAAPNRYSLRAKSNFVAGSCLDDPLAVLASTACVLSFSVRNHGQGKFLNFLLRVNIPGELDGRCLFSLGLLV